MRNNILVEINFRSWLYNWIIYLALIQMLSELQLSMHTILFTLITEVWAHPLKLCTWRERLTLIPTLLWAWDFSFAKTVTRKTNACSQGSSEDEMEHLHVSTRHWKRQTVLTGSITSIIERKALFGLIMLWKITSTLPYFSILCCAHFHMAPWECQMVLQQLQEQPALCWTMLSQSGPQRSLTRNLFSIINLIHSLGDYQKIIIKRQNMKGIKTQKKC